MRWLVAGVALTTFTYAFAGDWLSFGGDAQHSGWQKRGKHLTAANVRDLKLLWKRQLDRTLSAPVIVGPTITHRGVRELVFAGGDSDNFYAVDADLGTLFWKRHFEGGPTGCGPGLIPTAVIEPGARKEKEDDDEPGPMKPVYVVAGDGRLHKVRPSDGADMMEAIAFLPRNGSSSSLNFASGVVYATTSEACAGVPAGVWAIDAKNSKAKASFFPAKGTGSDAGVSIGADGSIYCAIDDKVLSLNAGSLQSKESFTASGAVRIAPVPFQWKGRELIAAGSGRELFLLDSVRMDKIGEIEADSTGNLATGEDPAGTRWIYTSAAGKIVALRISGTSAVPKLERAWESREIASPGPPVVSNGIVFVLANGPAHATLIAFDASTGKELYSSGDSITSVARSPALAVANGHVCFATADGTLYCFGIPIQ